MCCAFAQACNALCPLLSPPTQILSIIRESVLLGSPTNPPPPPSLSGTSLLRTQKPLVLTSTWKHEVSLTKRASVRASVRSQGTLWGGNKSLSWVGRKRSRACRIYVLWSKGGPEETASHVRDRRELGTMEDMEISIFKTQSIPSQSLVSGCFHPRNHIISSQLYSRQDITVLLI